MKVTKSSLIDWHVENDSGKIIARISKEKGLFNVYARDFLSGKMELFMSCLSFKEAKQQAAVYCAI